jgi:hypothetical protein
MTLLMFPFWGFFLLLDLLLWQKLCACPFLVFWQCSITHNYDETAIDILLLLIPHPACLCPPTNPMTMATYPKPNLRYDL